MSAKPVRALSKTTPESIGLLNEGLILMDEKLGAIAADKGATWILGPERPESAGPDTGWTLPDEIRELINGMKDTRATTSKRRLKLGEFIYNCRVFVLRTFDDATDAYPYMALYITRDSSVADAVDLLAGDYNLTDREQEALKAIATGLTSKEIAVRMNISPNTVKSFVRLIMLKMGIDSRAAMMGKLLEYSKGKIDSAGE